MAKELPMGIPSKVSETSFSAAEKLILIQFPGPQQLPTADAISPDKSNDVEGGGAMAGEHPVGVVCSCVRAGWSLMSSLFCMGEEVINFSLLEPGFIFYIEFNIENQIGKSHDHT